MCPHSHAVVIGLPIVGFILLNAVAIGSLLGYLRHVEKKESRALARAIDSGSVEEKTVTIENRGAQGGTSGVAEVVTTGPSGTVVSTVPTIAGGAAVVSTTSAGITGHTVTVEPGKIAVVKAEHPVGKPEETTVVSSTQS